MEIDREVGMEMELVLLKLGVIMEVDMVLVLEWVRDMVKGMDMVMDLDLAMAMEKVINWTNLIGIIEKKDQGQVLALEMVMEVDGVVELAMDMALELGLVMVLDLVWVI
jgi:hypothetical protein